MTTDDSDTAAKELTFPNILAVVEYLNTRGWKVGKSAAYLHWKKYSKIRPREDGLFHIKDVLKYANTHLQRVDSDTIQQEKSRAEADKLKAQAEHWQIKTAIAKGLYVEKDAFERELARRAAVFRSDIEVFIRSQAVGIINLVSGDATKAPDLIEFMLDQAEGWLDRYSGEKEFTVPLPRAMVMDDEDDDDSDDEDLMEMQEEGVSEI